MYFLLCCVEVHIYLLSVSSIEYFIWILKIYTQIIFLYIYIFPTTTSSFQDSYRHFKLQLGNFQFSAAVVNEYLF